MLHGGGRDRVRTMFLAEEVMTIIVLTINCIPPIPTSHFPPPTSKHAVADTILL